MPPTEISVSEFVLSARAMVESSFEPLWISGEIANFTRAASGHWYFVLRDRDAQLDCVMLAQKNALVDKPPAEGAAVQVFGRPTLYAPRGRFQLAVRFMQPAGAGDLYQLFLKNKNEWAALGWFDEARKRPPVFLPTQVGVVSSTTGAALRDVLRTLKMRMPSVPVIVYPAPAQGAGAAVQIAAAINNACQRNECEALIVCRGGGGVEDLWAYNEKPVVEAIFRSTIPVLTGIGHQVDETLADYAADLRCPTPTAAAVAAVPLGSELHRRVAEQATLLYARSKRLVDDCAQRLDWATRSLSRPEVILAQKTDSLEHRLSVFRLATHQNEAEFRQRLTEAAAQLRQPNIDNYEWRLLAAKKNLHGQTARYWQKKHDCYLLAQRILETLSPQRTLERGYGIVFNQAGQVLKDASHLHDGEDINITLAKGGTRATIKKDKEKSNIAN